MDLDAVSFHLPDSLILTGNDYDEDDARHDEINQKEILQLIMAAFKDQEETFYDDDESMNTSDSSCQTSSGDPKAAENDNSFTEIDEFFDHQLFIPRLKTNPRTQLSPIAQSPRSNEDKITHDLENSQKHDEELMHLTIVSEDHSDQFENLNETDQVKIDALTNHHQVDEECQSVEKQLDDGDERNQQLEQSEIEPWELTISDRELLEKTANDKQNESRSNEITEQIDELQVPSDLTKSTHYQNDVHSNESLDMSDDIQNDCTFASKSQLNMKQQVDSLNEDKEQLEQTCAELQRQIRSLCERLKKTENDLDNVRQSNDEQSVRIFHPAPNQTSLYDENVRLRKRLEEQTTNEQKLVMLINELKEKIRNNERQPKRSESNSSDSSNETVIMASNQMDKVQNLVQQLEKAKRDHEELEEKYQYEKHELQAIVEQLREDVVEYEKYKEQAEEAEEQMRTNFDFELKAKMDEIHRILKQEYDENILKYQEKQQTLEREISRLQRDAEDNVDQKRKEFQTRIVQMKMQYEKRIQDLTADLNRQKAENISKDRLQLVEKEFEHLKREYADLSRTLKESMIIRSQLETEIRTLTQTIEKVRDEKSRMRKQMQDQNDLLSQEILKLNELNQQQTKQMNEFEIKKDDDQGMLKKTIELLEERVKDFESTIEQYDDYRIKVEENVRKLIQQRDKYKLDLRLARDLLTQKDEEIQHATNRIEELEKLKIETSSAEAFKEQMIKDGEKYQQLETEKRQLEQDLTTANQALAMADAHLKKEIEKIRISLEQEYQRRYEQQQLVNEHEKLRNHYSSTNLQQETEEIKQIYRAEMERLYHENIELSQHQAKLIDAHHQQMELMKKDLDESYNRIIEDFQHEKTRLQSRYDQIKQQLFDAQQTIELLKSNWNLLKAQRYTEKSIVRESQPTENDRRLETLQNRYDQLRKAFDQVNETLKQERLSHAKTENEHQQAINSLQEKIAELITRHTVAINEIKEEFYQERPSLGRRAGTTRPHSVPEFDQLNTPNFYERGEPPSAIDKTRVLFTTEMIALLRFVCAMIFDVFDRVATGSFLDHLEISLKKQIKIDLIQSRNTMIKEIRDELFQTVIQTFQSQAIAQAIIEIHLIEFDRLFCQIIDDCEESCQQIHSSVVSFQIAAPPENEQEPIEMTSNDDFRLALKRQTSNGLAQFYRDVNEVTVTVEDENSNYRQSQIHILTLDFEPTRIPSRNEEFFTPHHWQNQETPTESQSDFQDQSNFNSIGIYGKQKVLRNACQLFISPTVRRNA